VIPRTKIYGAKPHSTIHRTKTRICVWKWVPILIRHRIKGSVVDTKTKTAVFLTYKQNVRCPRASSWLDKVMPCQLFNLSINLNQMSYRMTSPSLFYGPVVSSVNRVFQEMRSTHIVWSSGEKVLITMQQLFNLPSLFNRQSIRQLIP